ncbi:MAG: hypothetical protein RJA70_4436 [Pseudomonadota bacterium]|jgi:hypothetical protein
MGTDISQWLVQEAGGSEASVDVGEEQVRGLLGIVEPFNVRP